MSIPDSSLSSFPGPFAGAPLLPFQIIESITICAYMAGEFGSIIENLDKMGLRVVPPVVRKLIDALNAKLDKTVDKVAESDIKETGK